MVEMISGIIVWVTVITTNVTPITMISAKDRAMIVRDVETVSKKTYIRASRDFQTKDLLFDSKIISTKILDCE